MGTFFIAAKMEEGFTINPKVGGLPPDQTEKHTKRRHGDDRSGFEVNPNLAPVNR